MYRSVIYTAAANTTMGYPTTTPSEAAPAYDEHPVNAYPPPGSASAYATLPQNEPDIELAHNHATPVLSTSNPPNPFAPHTHCEACDTITSAREKRASEQHCCLWVAIVFIVITLSVVALGTVAIGAKYRHQKD
jgi:hypothetical protein